MARGDPDVGQAFSCGGARPGWVTAGRPSPRATTRSARTRALIRDLLGPLGIEAGDDRRASLGGGVMMQFAYQFPEVCERLVLVSSGGLGRDVSWILRLLSLPGAEFLLPVAVPGFVRDQGNARAVGCTGTAYAARGWPRCGRPTPPSPMARPAGVSAYLALGCQRRRPDREHS